MKNLTLTFVLSLFSIFAITAQDINRIGNFLPGANFSRNTVAKNYVQNGTLPTNYRVTTAQTVASANGVQAIRITCDPASDFNRNNGLGVILAPSEKVLMKNENGSWKMVAVLVCGNWITNITFIHYPAVTYTQPAQQQPVYTQPVQQQPVYTQPVQQQPVAAQSCELTVQAWNGLVDAYKGRGAMYWNNQKIASVVSFHRYAELQTVYNQLSQTSCGGYLRLPAKNNDLVKAVVVAGTVYGAYKIGQNNPRNRGGQTTTTTPGYEPGTTPGNTGGNGPNTPASNDPNGTSTGTGTYNNGGTNATAQTNTPIVYSRGGNQVSRTNTTRTSGLNGRRF